MLLSGGGPGEKDEKRALVGAESRPNDLSCTFLFRNTLANASRRAFLRPLIPSFALALPSALLCCLSLVCGHQIGSSLSIDHHYPASSSAQCSYPGHQGQASSMSRQRTPRRWPSLHIPLRRGAHLFCPECLVTSACVCFVMLPGVEGAP